MKKFKLLGPDGQFYESLVPGLLGGNSADMIYGKFSCPAAKRALRRGDGSMYRAKRVFFADEAAAIAAGYRPCGTCMRSEYNAWKERWPAPIR